MTPPSTDTGSRSNGVDVVVLVLDVLVAGQLGFVHVLDGVVAVGCPDTPKLTLVRSIDGDLLEDGVPRHGGGKGQEKRRGELHCRVEE